MKEHKGAEGAPASFRGMTNFLECEIAGTVIGVNCWAPDMLKKTDYHEKAYQLGKSL